MECSCSIEPPDYSDPCTLFNWADRKAYRTKKPHKCSECHRVIQPGEIYRHEWGLWDDWETYKTCSDCMSIRKQFFTHGWMYEHIMEEVRQYIFDMDGEIPETCIAELTPAAREKICEMVELAWDATDGPEGIFF